MDKERRKKLEFTGLIIREFLMVATIIAMVIVLVFLIQGYKIGEDWNLEQTGLVQVGSYPTGGTVQIDDDTLFARTNLGRSVTAGDHTVSISKDGFLGWSKQITVQSGLLLKLDYPRLIKSDRELEEVAAFTTPPAFVSIAPNRNSILYGETGKNWTLLSIRGDEKAAKTLDISTILGYKTGQDAGEIKELKWSENSEKVILKYQTAEKTEIFVLNLTKISESVNLTAEFGLDFSDLEFASDSGDKIIALEKSGNLREIDLGNLQLSKVLISGVESFTNLDETVIYVLKRDNTGVQKVGYYTDRTAVTLKTFGGLNQTSDSTISTENTADVNDLGTDPVSLTVGLSEYLGEKYLLIAADQLLTVYKGPLSAEDGLAKMEAKAFDLNFHPSEFTRHARGRLLSAESGQNLIVYNAELGELSQFTLDGTGVIWLDGYLLGTISPDSRLTVYDFDGLNRRTLSAAAPDYPAVISGNDKWLYYFREENGRLVLIRENLQ